MTDDILFGQSKSMTVDLLDPRQSASTVRSIVGLVFNTIFVLCSLV